MHSPVTSDPAVAGRRPVDRIAPPPGRGTRAQRGRTGPSLLALAGVSALLLMVATWLWPEAGDEATAWPAAAPIRAPQRPAPDGALAAAGGGAGPAKTASTALPASPASPASPATSASSVIDARSRSPATPSPYRPPGPSIAPPPGAVAAAPAYARPDAMPGPASMRALQALPPAARVAAPPTTSRGELLGVIVFAPDAVDLPPDAIPALQAMVQAASAAPRQPVLVVPSSPADGLAQDRAARVHEALRALGVSAARLQVQAPPAPAGVSGLRDSRRVEVHLGASFP